MCFAKQYPASPKGQYSLEDLQVLSTEQAFDEFFDHAYDPLPSKRQAAWKAMVISMSENFADSLLKKSSIQFEELNTLWSLTQWAPLKEAELYKDKLNKIGKNYFNTCFKEAKSEVCTAQVKQIANLYLDPDLGIELFYLSHDKLQDHQLKWSLVSNGLKTSISEFYCKKPSIQNFIWSAWIEGKIKQNDVDEFHLDCKTALAPFLHQQFETPSSVDARQKAYSLLQIFNALSSREKDLYFVTYLLETPSPSEDMNLAWAHLEHLKRDPARREQILALIKELPYLPDNVFSSFDLTKRKAILHLFKNSFPEYLDYYVHQCINYRLGVSSFKKGNPTQNCAELMDYSTKNNLDLFPSEMIHLFDKTKI